MAEDQRRELGMTAAGLIAAPAGPISAIAHRAPAACDAINACADAIEELGYHGGGERRIETIEAARRPKRASRCAGGCAPMPET